MQIIAGGKNAVGPDLCRVFIENYLVGECQFNPEPILFMDYSQMIQRHPKVIFLPFGEIDRLVNEQKNKEYLDMGCPLMEMLNSANKRPDYSLPPSIKKALL